MASSAARTTAISSATCRWTRRCRSKSTSVRLAERLRAQRVALVEQDVARGGAVVEEQVEEAEVRAEAELGVALRVRRVIEVLPDHADAAAAHLLGVEPARGRAARQVAARADLAAEIDQACGAVAGQAERRRAHDRHVDAEPTARELEEVEVEIEQ